MARSHGERARPTSFQARQTSSRNEPRAARTPSSCARAGARCRLGRVRHDSSDRARGTRGRRSRAGRRASRTGGAAVRPRPPSARVPLRRPCRPAMLPDVPWLPRAAPPRRRGAPAARGAQPDLSGRGLRWYLALRPRAHPRAARAGAGHRADRVREQGRSGVADERPVERAAAVGTRAVRAARGALAPALSAVRAPGCGTRAPAGPRPRAGRTQFPAARARHPHGRDPARRDLAPLPGGAALAGAAAGHEGAVDRERASRRPRPDRIPGGPRRRRSPARPRS